MWMGNDADGLLVPRDHGIILRSGAEQIATRETFKLSFDRHPDSGNLLMAGASAVDTQRYVDVSWLKGASEAYHISDDIRDYVLAEVPIVEANVPNRNMDCFLDSRLVEFLPMFGCYCYQTFIGKPTFYEHQHDDATKAKGVIFDASLREVNGRLFVFILKGFDRTKDARLAEDVLTGRRKGHSMSAWTSHLDCCFCGHRFDTAWVNACTHLKGKPEIPDRFLGKGQVIGGRLVYALPYSYRFFESSSVGDPAAYSAWETWAKDLGADA